MTDPALELDFPRLAELSAELDDLEARGELTKEAFDLRLEEATKVCGDYTDFLEGFLMRGIVLGFVDPPGVFATLD